jgi:hypothetical protein
MVRDFLPRASGRVFSVLVVAVAAFTSVINALMNYDGSVVKR